MDIETAMGVDTAAASHSAIDDRLRAALAANALATAASVTSLTGLATDGPGPGDDDDDDDDDRPGGDVGNIDPDDDEGYDDEEDDDDEEPLQVKK